MSRERSPQTDGASARDGHSPQGDIAKRRKAKGTRRKEVRVGCSICRKPYVLRLKHGKSHPGSAKTSGKS